jgi:hypothetical protein
MGIKRNSKRLAAAAIAIAGLTGGAIAVHADTLVDKFLPTAVAPTTFPVIPATTCATSTVPDTQQGIEPHPCEIDLLAAPSTVTVKDVTSPGGLQPVNILGFGVNISNPSLVTLAGGATSTIKVPVGTALTIHFSAPSLTDLPLLSFPSLRAGSVTKSADGHTYSFTTTADMVGTSVFQPGSNAQAPRQIAMGLVGVLIVTPAACNACAYDAAVSYVDEAIVATTDLDLAFALDFTSGAHNFNMGYFGQSPSPDGSARKVYHLVNGKSFPDTTVIDVPAGQKVLLRYVNAGVSDRSMGMLGIRQTLLARNGSLYTDGQTLIAPLVGPGETADVELNIPASAFTGQFYSLMDQGRQMNHGTASGFGGALVFLEVWPYTPPVMQTQAATPDATSQNGVPAGPVAPTTPGAPSDPGAAAQGGGQPVSPSPSSDPGTAAQGGSQPVTQSPPQSPPPPGPSGAPSGTGSEGAQPVQPTTGP